MMVAIAMIVTNLAGKYVKDDLDIIQTAVVHQYLARRMFWVCVAYIGTRDVLLSGLCGFVIAVFVEICDSGKNFFLLENEDPRVQAYASHKRDA